MLLLGVMIRYLCVVGLFPSQCVGIGGVLFSFFLVVCRGCQPLRVFRRGIAEPPFVKRIYDARKLLEQLVVVRDGDDGGAPFGLMAQEGHDKVGVFAVEVGCGLVGEDNLWIAGQGAGYADALLFATGELVRPSVGARFHAHKREQFADTRLPLRLLSPPYGAENEVEIVIDGTLGEQAEVLKDDAYLAAQQGQMARFQTVEVEVEHPGFALSGGDGFSIDDFEERTLSGSHNAGEVDKLALVGMEIYVVEDGLVLHAQMDIFERDAHSVRMLGMVVNGEW